MVCSGLGRYSDEDDEDGKLVKKKASLPKKSAVKIKPKPNLLMSSEDEDWINRNPKCKRSYGKASGVIRRSGGLGIREGSSLGGAGVWVIIKKLTTIVEDNDHLVVNRHMSITSSCIAVGCFGGMSTVPSCVCVIIQIFVLWCTVHHCVIKHAFL